MLNSILFEMSSNLFTNVKGSSSKGKKQFDKNFLVLALKETKEKIRTMYGDSFVPLHVPAVREGFLQVHRLIGQEERIRSRKSKAVLTEIGRAYTMYSDHLGRFWNSYDKDDSVTSIEKQKLQKQLLIEFAFLGDEVLRDIFGDVLNLDNSDSGSGSVHDDVQEQQQQLSEEPHVSDEDRGAVDDDPVVVLNNVEDVVQNMISDPNVPPVVQELSKLVGRLGTIVRDVKRQAEIDLKKQELLFEEKLKKEKKKSAGMKRKRGGGGSRLFASKAEERVKQMMADETFYSKMLVRTTESGEVLRGFSAVEEEIKVDHLEGNAKSIWQSKEVYLRSEASSSVRQFVLNKLNNVTPETSLTFPKYKNGKDDAGQAAVSTKATFLVDLKEILGQMPEWEEACTRADCEKKDQENVTARLWFCFYSGAVAHLLNFLGQVEGTPTAPVCAFTLFVVNQLLSGQTLRSPGVSPEKTYSKLLKRMTSKGDILYSVLQSQTKGKNEEDEEEEEDELDELELSEMECGE